MPCTIGIDAIILGEELIPYKVGFIQTLKGWMK